MRKNVFFAVLVLLDVVGIELPSSWMIDPPNSSRYFKDFDHSWDLIRLPRETEAKIEEYFSKTFDNHDFFSERFHYFCQRKFRNSHLSLKDSVLYWIVHRDCKIGELTLLYYMYYSLPFSEDEVISDEDELLRRYLHIILGGKKCTFPHECDRTFFRNVFGVLCGKKGYDLEKVMNIFLNEMLETPLKTTCWENVTDWVKWGVGYFKKPW